MFNMERYYNDELLQSDKGTCDVNSRIRDQKSTTQWHLSVADAVHDNMEHREVLM